MERAVIRYQARELEAWEDQDGWTVRIGELEASSRYLDLALAALLEDGEDVHQLAARLLTALTSPGLVEAEEAVPA